MIYARTSTAARVFTWAALAALLLVVLLSASAALADRLTLNDGTVLDGTVIKQGDNYWVKTPDGQRKVIPATNVKSLQKGSAPGPAAAAPSATASPAAAAGTSSAKPDAAEGVTAPATGGKLDYVSTERKANAVDAPLAAVTLWQAFIDSKPNKQELGAARAEMAKWKKLAETGAEKIKGRWVGGDERKQIVEKSKELNKEGFQLLKGDQTVQAIKKFEEAAALYPNSFQANFFLGYIQMLQKKEDQAQKYFDQCLRLRPNSAETYSNIGLIHLSKKRLPQAVQAMGKAAELGDSKEIAQNLVSAVSYLPPAQRRSEKLKPAIDAARLLGAKYGLNGPSGFIIVGLGSGDEKKGPPGGDGVAAGMSSGTGFVISADGLILTNRHVVDGGKTFLVMMNDNTQKSAEVVVIDDEQDLALIRVKLDPGAKLPFVRLSGADNPADGAECTVMGYPLLDRLGAAIKITRGIVSSSAAGSAGAADVLIDAKVNPGNSGGPILDRYGNVMAIVSMKSLATATEESYGMGISAGRIRKFLEKNAVKVDAGADGADVLSAQDIAAKVKPAAVCILATH